MTTHGTLCYIIKSGKVLLINKKKGLGAGRWNGPGGKVEGKESPDEAVGREVYEEVRIVPEWPKKVGMLDFWFGEGNAPAWTVHVYVANDYDGFEKETAEAAPKWFSVSKIPYAEMWPSDQIWMPLMLQGKKFSGKFYFDEEAKNLIRHEIVEEVAA